MASAVLLLLFVLYVDNNHRNKTVRGSCESNRLLQEPQQTKKGLKMDDKAVVAAYAIKTARLSYRGLDLPFALSHGLFSSDDIDTGTKLLLRTVSRLFDQAIESGKALPYRILDAGSGVGVIGVAITKALIKAGVQEPRVRAQDRDELARAFTAFNAQTNGLSPPGFIAAAEALLAVPAGADTGVWDLVLSNLPAKAGEPVLRDFAIRSAALLSKEGRAAVVIVNSLAPLYRAWLLEAGLLLNDQVEGAGHTVFVYTRGEDGKNQIPALKNTIRSAFKQSEIDTDPLRVYQRHTSTYSMEDVEYQLKTIHGADGFDKAGREALTAAALCRKLHLPQKLGKRPSILIHEASQGHFPCWLSAAMEGPAFWTLCGRNILALDSAARNLAASSDRATGAASPTASGSDAITTLPLVDPAFGIPELLQNASACFRLFAAFPDFVPRTDRIAAFWRAASALTAPDSWFLAAAQSAGLGRLDRAKPASFIRAGELKRDGFRAIAYLRRPDKAH